MLLTIDAADTPLTSPLYPQRLCVGRGICFASCVRRRGRRRFGVKRERGAAAAGIAPPPNNRLQLRGSRCARQPSPILPSKHNVVSLWMDGRGCASRPSRARVSAASRPRSTAPSVHPHASPPPVRYVLTAFQAVSPPTPQSVPVIEAHTSREARLSKSRGRELPQPLEVRLSKGKAGVRVVLDRFCLPSIT